MKIKCQSLMNTYLHDICIYKFEVYCKKKKYKTIFFLSTSFQNSAINQGTPPSPSPSHSKAGGQDGCSHSAPDPDLTKSCTNLELQR